jgi:cobalt/nickel transport system ATP-binding protein
VNPFANPSPSVFHARDLCYSYDNGISALDHIHFDLQAGERVAILGSNGSGKSTLLKILDGLFFPSAGEVFVWGELLTESALQEEGFHYRFRSHVGLLMQDSDAQLFMPSVREEVAFAPLQMGLAMDAVQARVESALDSLGIRHLQDRAPHQLSGGEKKRVALASILSLAPDVWLLDEPSAGLDPRSVAWLLEYLCAPEAAGRTVVTATHDLSIVEKIADRVYVLDERHQILEAGASRDVISNQSLLVRANLKSARV